MGDDASSCILETKTMEVTGDAANLECVPTAKTSVNGDKAINVTVEKLVNGDSCSTSDSVPEVDDEKINEMFTDDMVNEMKEEFGDNSKESSNENKEEFTDQSDQKDSEALEMKMKNSEKNVALQLFQQGKRNLLIKDFDAAVETLAAACEKFSSIYGELSAECGEVFMSYGHALIELWRCEESNKKEDDDLNGTNKSVSNDVAEDKNESDNDAVAETEQNVEDSAEMNGSTAAETIANGGQTEETEGDATNEESGTKPNDEEETPANDDVADDESAEENNEEDCEEDEDIDNLQLAWEIFETAKTIYTKLNDETNLARVHTKLGEISIASGNYELAVEDLKKSLAILNKSVTVKPRQLADVHFQLYTAYSANYNFDLAEIEMRHAKNLLEEQLGVLSWKLSDLGAASDEAKQINVEIKELEELTKDINDKFSELKASKRQLVGAIMNKIENQKPSPSIGENPGSSGVSPPFPPKSSPNVPVNNISHLVRKKPKDASSEKLEDQNKMTNGSTAENSKEDVQVPAKEIVKFDAAISSPTCKRKAEDESEEAEVTIKKQCINQD